MALTSVTERPIEPAATGTPDRVIRRVGVAVIVVSTLLFTWFATTGGRSLFGPDVFGGFFDLQGRAMFHGHLNVPAGSLGFEGFLVDGRTYTYFGVFPSILRMPVLLLTDRLDGRLTAVSMIIAHVVAMWSVLRIVERVHRIVRPGQRWSRAGAVVAGVVLVAAGLGSNLLYAASRAWVYHEAGLWGAAGVLAAFAAIFDFLLRPRLRPVVYAGVWTAVAWLSRGSVGVAPSLVLGLLGIAHLTGLRFVQALAPRPSPPDGEPADGPRHARVDRGPEPSLVRDTTRWPHQPRLAAALLAAAVVGGVAFGVVNTAKFGSPTALPFDKQVATQHAWPARKAAIAKYGGDLLSPTLVPVNVIQDLRPDLLSPSALWPLVRYRDAKPVNLFDPVFDTVEPSAGLTLTVPALLVLTVIAAVGALRRRRRVGNDGSPDGVAVLRPFLLGATLAALASLSIAFISQRYLSDAVPLLVVGGAGGAAIIDRWASIADTARRRRQVRVAVGALVAVSVFGAVTNIAVTWLFQRVEVPKDTATRVDGVRARLRAHQLLGLDLPPVVKAATAPGTSQAGKILIVGDCAAMYWGADNGKWFPMQVSNAAGHHRLRVELNGGLGSEPVPLLTIGDQSRHAVLAVAAEPGRADRVRLLVVQDGRVITRGAAFDVDDLRGEDLDVWVDPVVGGINVSKGERFTGAEQALLFQAPDVPVLSPTRLGANPFGGGVGARFPGVVREREISLGTCKDLLDAS